MSDTFNLGKSIRELALEVERDRLVAALEAVLESMNDMSRRRTKAIADARAVLARAKGDPT